MTLHSRLAEVVAFCERALAYKDAHPNCGGVMPEVDYVKAREQAAEFLREFGGEIAGLAADKARLDALELYVHEYGGIILHDGNCDGDFGGLGLRNTGRTLRKAIDQSCLPDLASGAGGRENS